MISHSRAHLAVLIALLLSAAAASAQVIEYESGGLKYQTMTRKGVTIISTRMPAHVREYAMMQITVSNGSGVYWMIRPEDFSFTRSDGQALQAVPAREVVHVMMEHASHNDVVKLITAYETALYGIAHMKSTNGYEQRRQNAMSEGVSAKFKAAAAASAMALVQTRLAPGQSTDGAVFFPADPKTLTGGRMVVHTGSETFQFNPE
jgi:hypothetical protein